MVGGFTVLRHIIIVKIKLTTSGIITYFGLFSKRNPAINDGLLCIDITNANNCFEEKLYDEFLLNQFQILPIYSTLPNVDYHIILG